MLTSHAIPNAGWALVMAWCSCGDLIMNARDIQMATMIICSIYLAELMWRLKIDNLVVVHHLIYCLVLITIGFEYSYQAYQRYSIEK
jgi:hypothetical protein